MEFRCHISRRLHEEHAATLALWGSVERMLAKDGALPAALDPQAVSLLRRASASLSDEIARHFSFEEDSLFPRLTAAGEHDLAELLTEEHETIRAAAGQFAAAIARDIEVPGAWGRARALALELAERLSAHVQKEEMSLLPALDDILDETADRELSDTYLMS